jgi:serpin B
VSLSSAVHKSFIDVNEEGSEAAAATALFGFRSARAHFHTDFVANHPFLFLIYDNKVSIFTRQFRP